MTGRKSTVPTIALAALASLALAGCGGSSSHGSLKVSGAGLVTPGATRASAQPKSSAVAYVRGTPISKSTYEHWLGVDEAIGVSGNAGHHALGFLITSSWVLGEAAERHVSVSAGEVKKRLANLEQKNFPKAGQLHAYLAKSRQSTADLQARVQVELLQGRIAEAITQGKSSKTQREAALARFQRRFAAHWKALTTCKPAYVMEDCKEYKRASDKGASG